MAKNKVFGNEVGTCAQCGSPIGDETPKTWCPNCGEPLPQRLLALIPKHKDRVYKVPQSSQTAVAPSGSDVNSSEAPLLAVVLYVLAALALIGGVIGAIAFSPGDAGIGYTWKAAAYTSSVGWFVAGVVEAALFAAAGKALVYLHQISMNTQRNKA